MEVSANYHFRFGILSLDSYHTFMALFFRHYICHIYERGRPIFVYPGAVRIKSASSITFNRLDKGHISRFTRTKRIPFGNSTFIGTVTQSTTKRKGFVLTVENLCLRETEHVLRIKIFFEALYVIIYKETDGERVGNHIYLH